MDDSELVPLLQRRPEQGYAVLIHQYSNLVYAIVWKKLKAIAVREDVEDCVAEIFASVYEGFDRYDVGRGNLRQYICMIAKNTAVDYWRKMHNTVLKEALSEEQPVIENSIEKREEHMQLWQAIKALGEPDTSIVIYKYFYEETTEKIAKRLHMTKAAVYKRQRRVLNKLRQRLSEKGSDK